MGRMTGSFRRVAGQRGFAMVEFVIGLPILLLLLLAVAETGRMISEYNMLTMATRDAARYVSRNAINPTLGTIELSAGLTGTARNLLVYNAPAAGTPVLAGLTPGDVQIVAVGSEHVRVSVTYTFRPAVVSQLPGFFGEAISLEIPLTASTVMRAM